MKELPKEKFGIKGNYKVVENPITKKPTLIRLPDKKALWIKLNEY